MATKATLLPTSISVHSATGEDRQALITLSPLDRKAQAVAQAALASRPLHQGTLEATAVSANATNLVGAIRDATVQGTGESPAALDPIPLALGLLTAEIGALQIQRGIHGIHTADKIGDDVGIQAAFTRFARGPADMLRGGAKIASGGIDAAGKASALSGVVSALGIVAAAGSSVTALAVGTLCTINLMQTVTVGGKFKKILKENGESAAFEHLREMRTVTEADADRVLENLFNPKEEPRYKKVARFLSHKFFGDQDSAIDKRFQGALKEASEGNAQKLVDIAREYPVTESMSNHKRKDKPLSAAEEKIKAHLMTLLRSHPERGRITECQLKHLVMCIHDGLYEPALEREQARKETIFERTMGTNTKQLIEPLMKKDIAGISAEEVQAVVKSAQKGLRNNTIIFLLGIIGSTVWLGLTIAAQICTAGTFALVEVVISLVLALVFVGVDGYFLWLEYKNSHALKKDKLLIFIGSLLATAVMGVAVALAKSALNMALTGAATFIWLGIILYTIYQWRNQPKGTEQAPTPPSAPPRMVDEGYVGSGSSGEGAAQ